MSPGIPWRQIDALFQQALGVEPHERAGFLARVSGNNADLRAAVEALLHAADESGDFLETPVEAACDLPWQEMFTAADNAGEAAQERADRSGERVGPYRLLRQLGRGGMATVYLAERADGQWEQEVALKVIRRGLDTEDVVRRFLGERQILSSLQHPNIARLLDGGTTSDGLPFFAMEHVAGQPITVYCDQRGLTIEQRLRLFRDVGRAVQYAHRNLVVHRDLKPTNILVTDQGTAKLLDFGIAKLLDPVTATDQTRTGLQLLTPQYASPEQVRGDPITTASDVYQLGMLLCELLAGRRPYEVRALSPAQIEARIVDAEPKRPSSLVTEDAARVRGVTSDRLVRKLRGDLDTIVLKALQKEPERRYPSAEALTDDVERYERGLAIKARPSSWRYHIGKWARRNRAAALAVVAGLTLLVAWGVTATVQSSALTVERDRVREEARRTAEVRDFLAGLFEASDPFLANGQPPDSITARDLLDAGARKLHQLDDEPALRAELAFTIGRTYSRLGIYDRARERLEEALALHQQLEGETGPSVAQDLLELGLAQRDPDSSVVLLERALVVGEAALGPSDLLVADVLSYLANRLSSTAGGSTPRTQVLHDRALAIIRSHPDAPRSQYARALTLSLYGRHDIPAMEEVLAITRELYGEVHPAVASSLSDLALAVERTDPLRADSLLTEALRIDEAILGEEHATTQMILNNLAAVKRDRGDFESAVPLYRRAVALRQHHQPESRVGLAYMIHGLGVSLLGLGQQAEAEASLRKTIAILTEELNDRHPLVVRASTSLARCLREQGRLTEAERLLTDLRTKLDGTSLTPRVKTPFLQELALVYQAEGREPERARVEHELAALRESQ